MNAISSKAMLVSLNISGWAARRLDEAASVEIAKQHGADRTRAGNYNKCLIDTKAESFKAVKQAEDRIRKYHYEHTLPWAQSGAQLLTQAAFFEYAAEMQKLSVLWEQSVAAFVEDYARLKANARHELNGLYKEDDYPDQDELQEKYKFGIVYLPVPESGDWRVELGAEREAAIRAGIDQQVADAVETAMKDLAKRLYEPVRHMADKLGTPGAIFRDSLVENVREMCELLPKLNLADDKELAALRDEVRDKLTLTLPETIRTDAVLRAEKAREAHEIARKMAAYMGRA